MISWKDLYNVLSNVVPLYVVLISAYASVKWWKIFSPNEITGINRFVALFAVPLLSIKFISNNNPYAMNFRFIAADTLQKLVVILVLFVWSKLSSRGSSLEWCITLFSLSTLPNTLVVGVPLLGGMYGEGISETLMVQLSVIQFNVWFPILLLLFEYRRATVLVPEKETEMSSTNSTNSSLGCSNKNDCNGMEFDEENTCPTELSSTSKVEVHVDAIADESKPKSTNTAVPAARSVTTRLILIMVCKKLMRNPNFYSSIIALTWSLISFRWHVKMPTMVANSIKIFSDTGLGMAMFSLGLFMASQPKIISGGRRLAVVAAAMRFIVGPTITAATSWAIGLRGTLLQIIIMQAALPQAIVTFVYAQEYNVHPGVLSTAVSFGMLISLPIAIVYYILLGIFIK